jgi:hypothetical protein
MEVREPKRTESAIAEQRSASGMSDTGAHEVGAIAAVPTDGQFTSQSALSFAAVIFSRDRER